jgi:hypothetical protein
LLFFTPFTGKLVQKFLSCTNPYRSFCAKKVKILTVGIRVYEVWQKSNETDFLFILNHQFYSSCKSRLSPFQNSSLGQLLETEELFALFVAVLKSFCWNKFHLFGYALLGIIQSTKMAPFQVVFERGGNKKKSQGLRSGE